MAYDPPIPSSDVEVLDINVKNIDRFTNSGLPTFTDRGGFPKKTLSGLIDDVQSIVETYGYIPVGPFAAGATLTLLNEVLQWTTANGGADEFYRWSGTFPKTVPPGSTPLTTGGFGNGAWLLVAGASFTGESNLAYLRQVATVNDAINVLDLAENQAFIIGERSNSVWDVVLTSGVTPNGFDIIQSVADVTYSFQLRDGRKLTEFGATPNADFTAGLQRFFAAMTENNRYFIDVPIIYSDINGVVSTVSNIEIVSHEGCKIIATSLNQDDNQPAVQFQGSYETILPTSQDYDQYKNTLTVLDATLAQVGDLIYVVSDLPFNGISGVGGFDLTYKCDLQRITNIVGNTLHFDSGNEFDIPNGNITEVRLYRPVNNITWHNCQIEGQGINGNPKPNGEGASGVSFLIANNCQIIGGIINGCQNRAVDFNICYNTVCDGARFDSLEDTILSSSFYGALHARSKYCRVSNSQGNNIRRVADTGGNGNDDLCIHITHENIIGTNCNGSAAGTHMGFYYSFENITASGDSAQGVTVRSINNVGDNIVITGDAGIGISFGGQLGGFSNGTTSGVTKLTNFRCDNELSAGIIIYNDGDYNIDCNIRNTQTQGIRTTTDILNSIYIRGRFDDCSSGAIVINRDSIATKIGKVDISDCIFSNNPSGDILINGTTDADDPAQNITMRDNISSSTVTFPYKFGTGYFQGETCTFDNNISTSGSGTESVDLGDPWQWTCRPQFIGNKKYSSGYVTQFQRAEQDVVIGQYDSIGSIPDSTTILDGDRILIFDALANEACENKCWIAGTTGTLSGVTGSISSGSSTITFVGNNATKVYKGCFITVPGAGASGDLNVKVESVSAGFSTATLSTSATNTVSGAAISYRPPSWADTRILTPT